MPFQKPLNPIVLNVPCQVCGKLITSDYEICTTCHFVAHSSCIDRSLRDQHAEEKQPTRLPELILNRLTVSDGGRERDSMEPIGSPGTCPFAEKNSTTTSSDFYVNAPHDSWKGQNDSLHIYHLKVPHQNDVIFSDGSKKTSCGFVTAWAAELCCRILTDNPKASHEELSSQLMKGPASMIEDWCQKILQQKSDAEELVLLFDQDLPPTIDGPNGSRVQRLLPAAFRLVAVYNTCGTKTVYTQLQPLIMSIPPLFQVVRAIKTRNVKELSNPLLALQLQDLEPGLIDTITSLQDQEAEMGVYIKWLRLLIAKRVYLLAKRRLEFLSALLRELTEDNTHAPVHGNIKMSEIKQLLSPELLECALLCDGNNFSSGSIIEIDTAQLVAPESNDYIQDFSCVEDAIASVRTRAQGGQEGRDFVILMFPDALPIPSHYCTMVVRALDGHLELLIMDGINTQAREWTEPQMEPCNPNYAPVWLHRRYLTPRTKGVPCCLCNAALDQELHASVCLPCGHVAGVKCLLFAYDHSPMNRYLGARFTVLCRTCQAPISHRFLKLLRWALANQQVKAFCFASAKAADQDPFVHVQKYFNSEIGSDESSGMELVRQLLLIAEEKPELVGEVFDIIMSLGECSLSSVCQGLGDDRDVDGLVATFLLKKTFHLSALFEKKSAFVFELVAKELGGAPRLENFCGQIVSIYGACQARDEILDLLDLILWHGTSCTQLSHLFLALPSGLRDDDVKWLAVMERLLRRARPPLAEEGEPLRSNLDAHRLTVCSAIEKALSALPKGIQAFLELLSELLPA